MWQVNTCKNVIPHFAVRILRRCGIQDYTVKQYYVYILASRRNGTLYIGISSDLLKRTYQHKNDLLAGFSKKYQVHDLVHYEQFGGANAAIAREKQLKVWKRKWKLELIEKTNPGWKDLYKEISN